MKSPTLAVLALLSMPVLSAQVAAVSIVDSIVDIQFVGGSNFDDELVLFRADGTYQDIAVSSHFSGGGFPTSPPSSGTYSYSVSVGTGWWGGPQTVGTITWTNGQTPRSSLQLSFQTPVEGQPGFGGPEVLSRFAVYPRFATTGAVNVSNNSWISAAHPTTPGFVIEGSNYRLVLIRGAGPALAQFGVVSPLASPQMTLYPVASGYISGIANLSAVYSNEALTGAYIVNSWSSDPNLAAGLQAIFSLAGAFQFPKGSNDCAALAWLAPGAYTIQASSSGADGQLLTEVYILPYGQVSP